jgi:26S proteasome regulatory subunit N1
MVARLYDTDYDLKINAYNMIRTEITSATSSMTSIPRPLKFLRLHYEALKDYESKYETTDENNLNFKLLLRDLLAVLVMVTPNTPDTTIQWVLEGTKRELTFWGIEFIRTLAGDISNEYIKRLDEGKPFEDLLDLVNVIVPHLIQLHSENEAIDILLEVEKLDAIMDLVNENNYKRICLYLMASSNYAADTEEQRSILEITYNIYTKFRQHANALRVAIKMNNELFIKQTFFNCDDFNLQKQLAFILGKQRIYLVQDDMPAELQNVISNLKLSEYFKKLATELDVLAPKTPEDIIKSHLEEKKSESTKIDSYKMNMALNIVSSFINAGFGTEALLSAKNSDWLGRNKEEGIINLLAGLGLVNLWDIDLGPNQLEKYMVTNERDMNKRAGYNIGVGIMSSGIRDENNIAYAILTEQLKDKNATVVISALLGLGLAYAGSQNDDLLEPLMEVIENFSFGLDVFAYCSLAFGLIYLGSGKEDAFSNIMGNLISKNEEGKTKFMENPYFVLFVLGMGLVVLGIQNNADTIIEATQLQEFSADMRLYIKTLLTACAYAGSGHVTKVQEMMHLIAKPKEEVNPKVKSIAVLGISMIAIGEEVGTEMVFRSLNHFLQYGDASVKKTVPIAMSILR